MAARMARIVPLVLGVVSVAASPALAQTAAAPGRPVTLRVDPLLIAEAGEVWSLIASPDNPIWPGWDASGTPLLFYLPGEQDVLINHPHPPEGFVPYAGPVRFPGRRILLKNGPTLIEWDGQNTSKDVGGVRTLVVADTLSNLKVQVSSLVRDPKPAAEKLQALRPSDLATDPYGQLAMVVHEAFHVFQEKQAPEKGANEMLLLYYPVLTVPNNVGFAQEGTAFAECLRATDSAAFRRAAVRWLALRLNRRSTLPPKAVEYEDGVEFSEGLAKYTEYRLFQLLEGRQPGLAVQWAQGFAGYTNLAPQRQRLIEQMLQNMSGAALINNDPYGTAPLRMRLYYSGMAVGILLDRLSPGWKGRIFAKDVSLTALVEEALKPSQAELEQSLKEARADASYDSLVESKTRLAKEGHARTEAMLKEIEEGPGIGLIVDYSGLRSSKVGMSFTPFGITAVDAERTIFTQNPVGVAFREEGSVAQKVAMPLLRDTGRRLVRFRLPPSSTRAEVQKALGSAQTSDGTVANLTLDLPSATVQAGKAQIKWKGEDLIIVLQNSSSEK